MTSKRATAYKESVTRTPGYPENTAETIFNSPGPPYFLTLIENTDAATGPESRADQPEAKESATTVERRSRLT